MPKCPDFNLDHAVLFSDRSNLTYQAIEIARLKRKCNSLMDTINIVSQRVVCKSEEYEEYEEE